MHMTWLDWAVVGGIMAVFVATAVVANRLTRSVSDYLVAGRSAGRYMLTVAYGMEWLGAINIVAMFETYYKGGFPCMWWVMLSTPFIVYMYVSGWGIYRYRETRSLTIAQFLETRYHRSVRLAAGILSWSAGMINFGLFPSVSARLLMSIIGLPESFTCAGVTCSTPVVLAAGMVIIPLCFIVSGGHTSVMVSNFMQGLFTNVAAVIIVAFLFSTFIDWNSVTRHLIAESKPEASLLDPLHTSKTIDFNAWYFIIAIAGTWYGAMSNVPSQAFLGSGKTAHEQRMGYLLSQIGWQGLLIFFMVIVVCSKLLMSGEIPAGRLQRLNLAEANRSATQPSGGEQGGNPAAARVSTALAAAPEAMRDKMIVSSTLPYLLPAGLLGLFCAVTMAALISSHNSFMHAWGGVLLQDIILLFRKEPLGTTAHLWALRASISIVGLTAFLLSIVVNPSQSILMLFAAVNSIWLGPAGAVMLGGLYWKKGTATAAMTTLLAGSAVGVTFFILQQGWPYWHDKAEFPVNGQYCFLINIVFSTLLYAAVSFLTCKEDFNMDRMLHRGRYAVPGEELPLFRPTKRWQTIFGITPMFNRRDRVTAYLIVGYFLVWLGVFAVGMIYGAIVDPGALAWARFWHFYLYISAGLLVVTTIWLGIGGLGDMASLFRSLRSADRDFSDTGEAAHEATTSPPASSSGFQEAP
jgi:solute:Na+ symporter, SSS family